MNAVIHYISEPKIHYTTIPPTTTTTTTAPLMFIPKILPASQANIQITQQKEPSIHPLDPSKLSQQKPNPNFHIGTSAPFHPTTTTTSTIAPAATTTTPSSKSRSLTELIRQKCESGCEKVCNAECRKQKDPPDEICV
uniref:Uncharacterized protein n=1 Tax=Panagrolaimus sp. PS1159 TaxID=55785 RepID=A0AC35G7W4_9BILA